MIEIKEIELIRVKLELGETLFVKIKSDDIGEFDLESLSSGLRKKFPNNQVIAIVVVTNDDIQLTSVKDVSYTESYNSQPCCTGNGCTCDKKE